MPDSPPLPPPRCARLSLVRSLPRERRAEEAGGALPKGEITRRQNSEKDERVKEGKREGERGGMERGRETGREIECPCVRARKKEGRRCAVRWEGVRERDSARGVNEIRLR